VADTLVGHALDDWHIRRRALEIARYAVDDEHGTNEGDDVFEVVTEGRKSANTAARRTNPKLVPYSECGDLPSYVLWTLVQELVANGPHHVAQAREAARTINRAEAYGYKVGANISKLFGSPAFVATLDVRDLRPGDIGLIGAPEHVFIVEGLYLNKASLVTIDYASEKGGGSITERPTVVGGRGLASGRPLIGYVDVAAFIARVRAAT
jgi:hypothetical protein